MRIVFLQVFFLIWSYQKMTLTGVSPWHLAKSVSNWEQNAIYQTLANFMCKKDICIIRLQSVIFGMKICILQTTT